ncbi:hypothetical protein RBB50_011756 [Rhinocladiella similis]
MSMSTSLAFTLVIEVVAALGVGTTFQAPLIAYQSVVGVADVAVATAVFGFVRSLLTSISVVVGGIVFQNGISVQNDHLSSILGSQLAQNFSASNAATNVLALRRLPLHQQLEVQQAYASSLKNMWIMYASIAGIGLRPLPPATPGPSATNNVELVRNPSQSTRN